MDYPRIPLGSISMQLSWMVEDQRIAHGDRMRTPHPNPQAQPAGGTRNLFRGHGGAVYLSFGKARK
jgi:hypothetical protein